jgi:hypothetical protein
MNSIENTYLFYEIDDIKTTKYFLKYIYNIDNIDEAIIFLKLNLNIMNYITLFRIASCIHYIYLNDEKYPFPEIIQIYKETYLQYEKKKNIKNLDVKIENYIISLKHKPIEELTIDSLINIINNF